jgi:transposase
MGIKREKFERTINGIKQNVYPEELKLQIIKELEGGQLSVKEAIKKYEIHKAATIHSWLKIYSETYRKEQMRVLYSEAERRQIAYKISSGVLSIEAASKHYRINQITISRWIKLYSCDIINPQTMPKKKAQAQPVSNETKELQEQLSTLQLKVIGLETMIDIAEKELNIDIRKKSGTKQSKQ